MITEWLMVGITFIYVIATVFICLANIKSAKATREQITISEQQYEESKRLNCMPFLQLEFSQDDSPSYGIRLPLCTADSNDAIYERLSLKNLGNGTAANIIYSWRVEHPTVSKVDCLPFNAIRAGDEYIILFELAIDNQSEYDVAKLTFEYNDFLGNSYSQNVLLRFNEFDIVNIENDVPVFLEHVKYRISSKAAQQMKNEPKGRN